MKETNKDKQVYFSVGTAFIAISPTFFLNESPRVIGCVFVIVGITFLILELDKKAKKDI